MAKAPAFQFYPGDWLKNTRHLSLQAKGAWIDILSLMWDSENKGKLSLSWKALSRAIGASIKSTKKVVNELVKTGVCDMNQNVTCNADVTKCSSDVTLVNRRMYREAQDREKTRLRVKKCRTKQDVTPPCNADVTVPSSSSSSSSTTKKKESIKESFNIFWNTYPEKTGKKKAQAAWEKLKPSGELLQIILTAIQKQTEWRLNAKPGEFRPEWAHPVTWLNGERWQDEVEKISTGGAVQSPIMVICPDLKCNHRYDLRNRDKNSRYPGCPKCRLIWLISIEDEIRERRKAVEAERESDRHKREPGPRVASEQQQIGSAVEEAMRRG